MSLAAQGERVIIACRNPEKAAAAQHVIIERSRSPLVETVTLDLASLASVAAAAADIADRVPRVDVLVNNAGLIMGSRTETVDGFETNFGVNHLGHFHLTTLLEERIKAAKAPRIINVSSMAHWGAVGGLAFSDLQYRRPIYNGWLAYARAKLANILFTRELAHRWGGDGVIAHALHPGTVASDFAGDGDTGTLTSWGMKLIRPTMISPEKGARTSVFLASAVGATESNGEYWSSCSPARTAPWANDLSAAQRLWDVSENLIAAGHP